MLAENASDAWLASDKLQHVAACAFIAVFISTIVHFFIPRIRNWSLLIGCVCSALTGGAKEFSDYLGFYSSGASLKDALADLVGILLAVSIWVAFRRILGIPGLPLAKSSTATREMSLLLEY
eukprot:TRINITY_DN24383_c0_g1_i1.p1 TRINITY_DN24383_c0_g1~~TRINITY_DN24383_c0_g1_i1.p1  ORF type:complete len:122 (+),score=1.56 TRINITY_DN24383_c0_g1_i1:221-586(+)